MAHAETHQAQLWQRLYGIQLFFIVISSVIGTGVFSANGEALIAAGPIGLILAVILLGIFACFVGETLSEFVQVFPVPNAVYQYVASFVDEELGIVIAILYWYTFASVLANQIYGASQLLNYWAPAPIWQYLFVLGLAPWVLLAINLLGVDYFGWIETAGGALKLILLFGVSCVLYQIAREQHDDLSGSPITKGLQPNLAYESTPAKAFFRAVPGVAYGYLGIETTVMAAFEARSNRSVAYPSRVLPWVIFLFYFMCTVGIALTVDWQNPLLGTLREETASSPASSFPTTNSPVIIAIYKSGRTGLAGFVNGCLIFSLLSAGNTSLYIASRVLYGLTYNLEGNNIVSRRLQGFSKIWRSTGVPAMALTVSILSFYWLPWLSVSSSIDSATVINNFNLTSSVSCLIVWAALCLAFHRYEKWTRKCSEALIREGFGRFVRDTTEYEKAPGRHVWNLLSWAQPWIARLGFCGCIIVFVSASARWWDGQEVSFKDVASAYGVHVIALALWVVLKLYKGVTRGDWRLYVPLRGEQNPSELIDTLVRLEWISRKGEHRNAVNGNTGG